jgi:hypothetical protein
MLNVAPVSTKYLSSVNSPVRKIKRASAGKCMAVAVVCPGIAAEAVKARRLSSLPTRCKVLHTCRPLRCSNCDNCTHHCWGFDNLKILVGREVTFQTGSIGPLVAQLPPSRSRAPIAGTCGSCNSGVVAAASVPQGVRSSNHQPGCLVVPTYHFSHGMMPPNEEHCKEQIVVRADEFTHNGRL